MLRVFVKIEGNVVLMSIILMMMVCSININLMRVFGFCSLDVVVMFNMIKVGIKIMFCRSFGLNDCWNNLR